MSMDIDSDESDFYGDDETLAGLKHRVDNFDPPAWWAAQSTLPPGPWQRRYGNLRQARQHNTAATESAPQLQNPYAGVPYAWQLTETVDDFLKRLPPATTDESAEVPWIYICNPYTGARTARAHAASQDVRGCEDEAPAEDGAALLHFVRGGTERLHMASEFADICTRSGKPQSYVVRESKKAGAEAASDILDLARMLKVRCGKWMLFCSPRTVNETWEIVAKATANNELGIAAKVAPRPVDGRRTSERLICVYTADFSDIDDVRRVAERLKRAGLVSTHGKPLYYKTDAYTYLGIASGNRWGIKASIYDTTTMLRKK